jgi:hypothetical protein
VWAGGGPDVPLWARLAARTQAVVAEASALVVFPASPAVARGLLPVVAFPLGFPVVALPELGGERPGCLIWVLACGLGRGGGCQQMAT